MRRIIIIIIITFLSITGTHAQSITKYANVGTIYPGLQFDYIISLKKITEEHLNQGITVTDILPPGVQFVSFLPDNSLFFLNQSHSVSDNTVTINISQGGNNSNNDRIIGNTDIDIRIRVWAKDVCDYEGTMILNKATMNIGNYSEIGSCQLPVEVRYPLTLQKTFDRYDPNTNEIVYDVRISCANLGGIIRNNYDNYSQSLTDYFTIPQGLLVQGYSVATSEGATILPYVALAPTDTDPGSNIQFSFNPNYDFESLKTYKVKIKAYCDTINPVDFLLRNEISYSITDICGNTTELDTVSEFMVKKCRFNDPTTELALLNSCIEKDVELDNNSFHLTQKNCTGRYVIKFRNCTESFQFKDFIITDTLPEGLNYNVSTGNFNSQNSNYHVYYNPANRILTIRQGNMPFMPQDYFTVIVPFTVTESRPDISITNYMLTSINFQHLDYSDINGTKRYWDTSATIRTVPNRPTVNTQKVICTYGEAKCRTVAGVQEYFDGDTVIYNLYFYNFGNVSTLATITDKIPDHLQLIDYTLYKDSSGHRMQLCNTTSYQNVTNRYNIQYNNANNTFTIPDLRLKEFSCNSVTQYVLAIRARIRPQTIDGSYNNQFKVVYQRENDLYTVLSNKVTHVVNNKHGILQSFDSTIVYNCKNKTATVQFTYKFKNIGNFPVRITLGNDINLSTGVAQLGPIFNYKFCSTPFTNASSSCIPSQNLDISGFANHQITIQPCEVYTYTYSINIDTRNVSTDYPGLVCDSLIIRRIDVLYDPAYARYAKSNNKETVVSLIQEDVYNNILMDKVLTNDQKAAVIQDIAHSSRISNYSINTFATCIPINDVCAYTKSECLGNASENNPITFHISSVNSTGQAVGNLSINSTRKVTKVDIILADIEMINPCKEEIRSIRTWRGYTLNYLNNCHNCSQSVAGVLQSGINNLNGLMLNSNFFNFYPFRTVMESNIISFGNIQNPGTIMQGNYTIPIVLPITQLNCNGILKMTFAAMVYFEDCSTCYSASQYIYYPKYTLPVIDASQLNLNKFE